VLLAGLAIGCGTTRDGAASDASNDAASPTELAPYFYTWGWGSAAYAFATLAEMKARGGPAAVTLAFVLSDGGCNATSEIHDHRADVAAYVAAGGHVKASFGGATGTYLETACGSAGELAAALGRFVDDTGITDLDFDLEQGATSSNAAVNRLRGAALKQLQDTRHVRVAFTLPVAPTGLLQDSVDILQAAVTAGVDIARVNGMTMDYGNGTDLGTTPSRSLDAMALQLRGLLPGLDAAQAYRRLGATAMIGKNDDDETFSLDNARALVGYARAHQLGLLSFWAIQRDQPCGASNELDRCSRVNTSTFQFTAIFGAVNAR
jgi:chitinase